MKRSNNKGLTLSELLLSSAILAFVITGLLALFVSCIYLNEANRNMTIAIGHAEYVLEQIKNQAATSFSGISASSYDWAAADVAAQGLDALDSESIDTTITGSDPLDVSVEVSWQDRRGRARDVSLRTLVTEP